MATSGSQLEKIVDEPISLPQKFQRSFLGNYQLKKEKQGKFHLISLPSEMEKLIDERKDKKLYALLINDPNANQVPGYSIRIFFSEELLSLNYYFRLQEQDRTNDIRQKITSEYGFNPDTIVG